MMRITYERKEGKMLETDLIDTKPIIPLITNYSMPELKIPCFDII